MSVRSLFFALSPRALVALAATGSAAVLLGALFFQSLGYRPCELCILQRWPHLFAALLGALMLAARLPMALALLGAAAALSTSAIGFYHSGVERHLFAGPDSCTSNAVSGLSPSDLLAQISAAPLVRCDEIVWDIFGVTMANLNALGALGFAVLWLAAWRRARNR